MERTYVSHQNTYREHADEVCVEGRGEMGAGLGGDGDVMYELPVPEVYHPEAIVTASLHRGQQVGAVIAEVRIREEHLLHGGGTEGEVRRENIFLQTH